MEELPDDVVAAIRSGNRVEAIKRLRKATSMDLTTARQIVMAYDTPPQSDYYEPSDAVMAALQSGRKIEAIKLIRDETGLGLRDAKLLLEAIEGDTTGGPQPVVFESTGGLGAFVKLVLALLVVFAVYSWLTL